MHVQVLNPLHPTECPFALNLRYPYLLVLLPQVLERAKLAISSGCDGVIASGLEVQTLRKTLGNEATIVTPGIRPADSSAIDDQKRIVTPKSAFEDGANYIVVGRPIRNAIDPKSMAETIQAEIAAAI